MKILAHFADVSRGLLAKTDQKSEQDLRSDSKSKRRQQLLIRRSLLCELSDVVEVRGVIPFAIVAGMALGTLLLAAFLAAAVAGHWYAQTYYFAPHYSLGR